MSNFSKNIKMLFKNNKGFTIVEMLVSISILAIITSFSVINFNTWKKNEDLRQDIRELADNIRNAQTKSMSGEMFGAELPSGYGIYFSNASSSSYVLFADLNSNFIYDGADGLIGAYDLANDVLISTSTPIYSEELTIIFKSPNAKIYINQNTSANSAKIELTHSDTGNSKIVEIRRITGRVDIQ